MYVVSELLNGHTDIDYAVKCAVFFVVVEEANSANSLMPGENITFILMFGNLCCSFSFIYAYDASLHQSIFGRKRIIKDYRYLNLLVHRLVRGSPFAVKQSGARKDPRSRTYRQNVLRAGSLTLQEVHERRVVLVIPSRTFISGMSEREDREDRNLASRNHDDIKLLFHIVIGARWNYCWSRSGMNRIHCVSQVCRLDGAARICHFTACVLVHLSGLVRPETEVLDWPLVVQHCDAVVKADSHFVDFGSRHGCSECDDKVHSMSASFIEDLFQDDTRTGAAKTKLTIQNETNGQSGYVL